MKNRNGFRLYSSFQTNDLWRYSFSIRGVSKKKDWYETRTSDRFILDPKELNTSIGIDSDNTKKFAQISSKTNLLKLSDLLFLLSFELCNLKILSFQLSNLFFLR